MKQSLAAPVQKIPRPVVLFAKTYEDGTKVNLHSHPRTQLLYATSGAMLAQTDDGSWVVPTGYGLVIPNGVAHEVDMCGAVALRSVYIQPSFFATGKPSTLVVIKVSDLLSVAIDRFAERPPMYEEKDIAHYLANIIAIEIVGTPSAPYAIAFPANYRLRGICERLLAQPKLRQTIDDWAIEAGMSRRAFTRAFKTETGITFDRWRQRLRYQIATAQLAKSIVPEQVAKHVGYGSAGALTTMMNRLEGHQ